MEKILSTGSKAWTVKVSRSKTKLERVSGQISRHKRIIIRKLKSVFKNEMKEVSPNNIADASKSHVQIITQSAIDSVNTWRRDMLARIDVVHQHILRMHNLQNSSNCQPEQFFQPANKQPDKKCEIFPSMPILFDESSNDVKKPFEKSIHPIVGNKIGKRRHTMCSSSSDSSDSALDAFDCIPLRRKARFAHSSAIAIAKQQLIFENQDKIDTVKPNVAESIINRTPKIETQQLEILQKLLETRKLVIEKQKHSHEDGLNGKVDDASAVA